MCWLGHPSKLVPAFSTLSYLPGSGHVWEAVKITTESALLKGGAIVRGGQLAAELESTGTWMTNYAALDTGGFLNGYIASEGAAALTEASVAGAIATTAGVVVATGAELSVFATTADINATFHCWSAN